MSQKLPIGVQNFEVLRNSDYVYIDKTQWLYQLVTQGRVYFLSRPRRFGKSLLISTLDALFQGKKHLFKNLWIESSDYVWDEFPVIWLDMSAVTNETPEVFKQSLQRFIGIIAERYHYKIDTSLPPAELLNNLIEFFAKKNQKVVVLIDEYDKPLIDQIHNPEVAIQNREILKHFYGILKSQDANIRFVLLTGVSKFSKVSVFSGLNNLNDISLSTRYAGLLGYTPAELRHSFATWIHELAQKEKVSEAAILNKIKRWYNGYQFSEADVQVYNPFSTLLLFEHQRFASHWFTTGTPTFLINLIEQKAFDVQEIERFKLNESAFSTYEVEHLEVLPLLYQTGYLTIKSYHAHHNYYTLGYPNWEVESAFMDALLNRFAKVSKPQQDDRVLRMVEALERRAFEEFFSLLKSFLAGIPYELHMKGEKYYQNIFYFIFTLVGLRLGAEVRTNRGRIDAVMEGESWAIIFELKVDKSAQEALQQIKEKGYAEKYYTQKNEIYLIGLSFNSTERNVHEYLIEKIR